ncbi:MAG: AraC family transcriptional regulator [Methyloceanibacter sp.]|uniref:AraC family transcriptional regulator n=1 Tax=Methyloceanibacter sp. TaxID=1965321 RepID=UPI003D6D0140
METQANNFGPVRFTTDDLPERDRVPVWREFFGRFVFRTEFEPAPDIPFHADVTVRGAPGLELVSSSFSPGRLSRTPALVADGNDDVSLCVATCGGALSQLGQEIPFSPGDAIVAMAVEPGTWTAHAAARYRCLHVRRADMAPLVASLDPTAVLRRVRPDLEALRYLLGYMRFLEEQTFADLDLARASALHLRDLFALVLGPTRDAAFVAQHGGLAAARLQAIKRHIVERLGDGRLTVGAVAARHRVTPRYVQRLFEREGMTFSEFMLDRRLSRAQQMLADPRYASWRVSAIALEAGFGDVSYFNRCFRRRFGETPTAFRL